MDPRFLRKLCPLFYLALCGAAVTYAQQLTGVNNTSNRKWIEQKVERQNAPERKLGGALAGLLNPAAAGKGVRALSIPAGDPIARVFGDSVAIEAIAAGDAQTLLRRLQSLGLRKVAVRGRVVGGLLPIANLAALADVPGLAFARPAAWVNHVGTTTSQGLAALRADRAPIKPAIDGTGVTIGVISDSFNCLKGAAEDKAGGDLPAIVTVLDDSVCPGGTDEGRGMMELIHDVAPGAKLAFHTLGLNQAAFASAIQDLYAAGANVIVDDILFLAEPMFQDGIVSQAVDDVVSKGVSYFSSAGNNGRNSYEDNYTSSGVYGLLGERHDFDPDAGVDTLLNFELQPGITLFVMQWQNPSFSVSGAPGAGTDLDILLNDASGAFTGAGSFNYNIGFDPVEMFGIINNGPAVELSLSIERFEGPPPGVVKIVVFNDFPILDFPTFSSTEYGHENAAGAITVGAAPYFATPGFGVTPARLQPYSSAGGTAILFDRSGAPIPAIIRKKPDIVAVDGGNTSFFGFDFEADGFPNFFGTSAAAAHAAAVGALMKQQRAALPPRDVRSFLSHTALDMTGIPGFDFDSGYGLIRADFAVAAVKADANHDGIVDRNDILLIRAAFGGASSVLDVNADGVVNILDMRAAVALCTHAGCVP